MMKRLWQTASLEKVLGIDLRSLAFLRVAIAIILLADWLNRFSNFKAFMSESGLFPRVALLELYGSPYIWSLNHIATGDWWQLTLMFVNLFTISALLVGWQTRLFTVACWVLQLSVQAKNPILMQSGDVLLRNILFWGMFLPWGAKFSLDAALSPQEKPKRIFTYATIGVCLQAIYVYFFSIFLKTGAQWRTDGTAVYYALNLDHFSTGFGKWMLTLPIEVLKFLNYKVLIFEFVGAILLLWPWGHKWVRPLLILGFWGMHLMFGATLAIGNFVLISIASTIPFIPTETWDWISEKLRPKTNAKAYYDEDCGFCIKMVAIVRTFLILPASMFRPAQSVPKIEKIMLAQNSWVFENDQQQTFTAASALRELVKHSPLFFWMKWLFYIPGVIPVGNRIYRRIAEGRSRSCDVKPKLTGRPPMFQLRPLENFFLAFVVVFVALWNLGTVPQPITRIAQAYEPFALLFRFEQKWEMFSPFPMTDDGWFIVKGKLRDGREVDLFQGGAPVTYEKPESVKNTYKDFRWRKYMVNLWAASFSKYRQYYSRYVCRDWNRKHEYSEQVVSLDIIYMKEDTPPPGQPLPVAEQKNIWNWNCF